MSNWSQRPPLGAMLDRGNPISNGLLGCYLFNEQAGGFTANLVGPALSGTLNANAILGPNGLFNNGSTTGGVDLNGNFGEGAVTGSPFTVMVWFVPSTVAAADLIMIGKNNGTQLFQMEVASGKLRIAYGTFPSGSIVAYTGGTVTAGLAHVGAFTYSAVGSASALYLNGSNVGTSTSVPTSFASTSTIKIGVRGDNAAPYSGSIPQALWWNRVLSDVELQTVYADRWCMVAPPPARRIFFFFGNVLGRRNLNYRTGSRSPLAA